MAVAIDFLGLGPIGLGSVPAADPAKGDAAEAAGRLILDVIARDVRPSALVTRDGARERDRRGHRHRRLDERGPPPARDRERGRRRARRSRTSTALGLDTGRHEPDTRRPVRRGRPPSRRRQSPAVIKQLPPPPARRTRRRSTAGRSREHAAGAAEPDGEVIAAAATPFKPGGALRVLRGNLAPEGAVVKLAGHERPCIAGPLASSTRRQTCKSAIYDGAGPAGRGGRRSQRGPGRSARNAGDALDHLGDRRPRARRVGRARHRRALQRRDPRADGRPRLARGGPWRSDRARSRRRRRSRSTSTHGRSTLDVDDAELARRRSAWTPPEPRVSRGVLARYARTVSSASTGRGGRMSGRLEGKVALVTGAGRGIGRALALGLAAEGASSIFSTSRIQPRSLGRACRSSARGSRCAATSRTWPRSGRRSRSSTGSTCSSTAPESRAGSTCGGSERGDLGPRDRHEPEGDVLLLERGRAPDARRQAGRSSTSRPSLGDAGDAELGRLCGEQGRDQRAHGPARDRARAAPDPRQRVRAGRDERRAEPRRRPVRTSRSGRR